MRRAAIILFLGIDKEVPIEILAGANLEVGVESKIELFPAFIAFEL
jgi:hypothetical protein